MKKCTRCFKEKNEIEFSTIHKKKTKQLYGECRVCMNTRNIARLIRLKIQAVEYKGGKCFRCGIIGNPRIYDFHHRDPSQKDFSISKIKSRSFENIKNELDKCDLLCAICHRMLHHEQVFISGTIDIELYERLLIQWFPNRIKQVFSCLCGAKVSKQNRLCRLCAHKKQERIEWPSDKELVKLVWEMPRVKLAKQLSISDKAIAKRCKQRNIKMPSRGYWQKQKS